LPEHRNEGLVSRIGNGISHEHTDPPRAPRLLRTRRERPRSCCATEDTEKFAPPHVFSPRPQVGS
jgi:hypothetical protein